MHLSATKYTDQCQLHVHCYLEYQSVTQGIVVCHLKCTPEYQSATKYIVYEDLPATSVHCTPMYQSVTWDIHLECKDIPEHRSVTKYTKTCQLHCTLFPGVSVSNLGYNRLSPGMFHSILCRWPIFTALHFRWQASIHRLTDWYTREQCSLRHILCCWPIFLYTLQVTGHYTQVTD